MLAALVLIGAALLAAGAGFGALQKRRRLSL
jgi:LPXTG-motif cell wall-anchored protein